MNGNVHLQENELEEHHRRDGFEQAQVLPWHWLMLCECQDDSLCNDCCTLPAGQRHASSCLPSMQDSSQEGALLMTVLFDMQANRIFESTSDQPSAAAAADHGGTRVLFDDSEENAAKAFVR